MGYARRPCQQCGKPCTGRICRACYCRGRNNSLSRQRYRRAYKKRQQLKRCYP